jgi:hypothetical protein
MIIVIAYMIIVIVIAYMMIVNHLMTHSRSVSARFVHKKYLVR